MEQDNINLAIKFGTKTIDVTVTTIDLEDIDFAKIDVEGAELLVLQGMKTLPKKMILEFNTENLKEHGTTPTEFFNFVTNYSIKQITKDGLIEPNYEKLLADKMATNLFLY